MSINRKYTRAELAALTRARLVSTMNKMFIEQPMEDIKVADICKEADVSIGTFYHYYRSKADYFREVLEEDDKRVCEIWEQYKNAYLDPIEAIKFLSVTVMQSSVKNGPVYTTSLYRFMLYPDYDSCFSKESQRVTEIRENILSRDKGYKYIINSQIEAAIEQRRLYGDADELFESLMDILSGVIYNWCYRDGKYDVIKRLSRLLNSFLGYYAIQHN